MPYLGLICNAMVWGLSWWPLRHLQAWGLHPLWATTIFFCLGVILVSAWQPGAWRVLRRTPGLWLLAIAAGGTNAAFNWAVSVGEVVRVVLLFYLMPIWAVLLARLVLHEPISRGAVLRIVLALMGALLVLKPAGAPWPTIEGLPDVLALAGGFGFALNNVLLRQQAHEDSSARALAMFVGGMLLPGMLAWSLAHTGLISAWPQWDLRWVLGALALGLAVFGANLALQYGAARVPVHISSVVMLTEIVFASASAVWLAGEVLTPAIWAGGALILLAALLATREETAPA